MQIYDFTIPELEYLISLCNFSDDELTYFNLRAKHKSNTQIAYEMNISESTVSVLASKVKAKLKRIL